MVDRKSESVVKVLILTWPNMISLLRIFAVPFIIWLILSQEMAWAFLVTVLAGMTDILDGMVARTFKTASTVGHYLDPIADKVLLVSLYLVLGLKGYLPDWLVILIVFRDLLIVAGAAFLMLLNKDFVVQPSKISKINTFLQIVGVVWVLGKLAFGLCVPFITTLLTWSIGVTTVLSGIGYVILWLHYISPNGEAR